QAPCLSVAGPTNGQVMPISRALLSFVGLAEGVAESRLAVSVTHGNGIEKICKQHFVVLSRRLHSSSERNAHKITEPRTKAGVSRRRRYLFPLVRPRLHPAAVTRRAGPVLVGLVLGLLALGPGLRRGFLLSYDMVLVPRQPFTPAMFGLAGGAPRAVPSDFAVAVASRLLPADIAPKLVLLLIFVL